MHVFSVAHLWPRGRHAVPEASSPRKVVELAGNIVKSCMVQKAGPTCNSYSQTLIQAGSIAGQVGGWQTSHAPSSACRVPIGQALRRCTQGQISLLDSSRGPACLACPASQKSSFCFIWPAMQLAWDPVMIILKLHVNPGWVASCMHPSITCRHGPFVLSSSCIESPGMQLRRRALTGPMSEPGREERGQSRQPYLSDQPTRRTSGACLHQDGQPYEQYGNQDQLLYRTASDGSPVVYQATDSSLASSASRLSPDGFLGMQKPEPSTPISRSWSFSHLAHHGMTPLPVPQAFGCLAPGSTFLLPKIEEGQQPALLHMPVAASYNAAQQLQPQQHQLQDSPHTGEVQHEFSRALGQSLSKEEARTAQQQQRAARRMLQHVEDPAYVEDDTADGGPRAPSKRGPRGTSSRYRGVTRHRCVCMRRMHGAHACGPHHARRPCMPCACACTTPALVSGWSGPVVGWSFAQCMLDKQQGGLRLGCNDGACMHSYGSVLKSRMHACAQAHQALGGAHLGRQEAGLPGRLRHRGARRCGACAAAPAKSLLPCAERP